MFMLLLVVAVALFVGFPLLAVCLPSPEEQQARAERRALVAAVATLEREELYVRLATPGPLRRR